MKLLDSINCIKGITLNSQLVDLLSILDNANLSKEEQDMQIIDYIENLILMEDYYKQTSENRQNERYRFILQEVLHSFTDMKPSERIELGRIYLSSINNYDIFDPDIMKQKLVQNGQDKGIHERIMKDLKNTDFTLKEGIKTLTPEKVRNLYNHLFENGNKYDRVTIDEAGNFSNYLSIDGKTICNERLDKVIGFCEKHGMKCKINSLIFYNSFPNGLNQALTHRIAESKLELNENYRKDFLKKCLIDYVTDIGKRYGEKIDTVDMFNELIYDPMMTEKDFEEKDATFHQRKTGWQQYLNLEDLCEIALAARKVMPNTTFTYNDMNWINSGKRKEIIDVINRIKEIECRFREEGKLEEHDRGILETIGVEAHLSTYININQIDNIFDDIRDEIHLPIEITEFDVARAGNDPESKKEIKKQLNIFKKFKDSIQSRDDITSFTIWSQSDDLSFLNDKYKRLVFASLLDSNFEEKDIDVDLIKQNKLTKFFNKFRALFVRTNKDEGQVKLDNKSINKGSEDNKTWKLNREEIKEINKRQKELGKKQVNSSNSENLLEQPKQKEGVDGQR